MSGEPHDDEPDLDAWSVVVPPVSVLTSGIAHEFAVHVRHGDDVLVTLTAVREALVEAAPVSGDAPQELEQLDVWVDPQEVDGELRGRATFLIPDTLAPGYYRVELTSDTYSERGLVLIVPGDSRAGEVSGWGLSIDLPATRSKRSWGVGDIADLAEVGVLAADWGADFVFPRPQTLSELRFEGEDLAPEGFLDSTVRARFLPASILRVEQIPELAYVTAPDRALIEWEAEEFTRANTSGEALDIASAHQGKSAALDLISVVELTTARRLEFERFVEAQGQDLNDFALWAAIAEACHRAGEQWPEDAADPESFGARRAGDSLEVEIEKHKRYQWHIAEQFAAAHGRARSAGMRIGLMRGAYWQPDFADLAANGTWFRAVTRGISILDGAATVGALRVTPRGTPVGDFGDGAGDDSGDGALFPPRALLAVLAIEADRAGVDLVLSTGPNSPWYDIAQQVGVATHARPWRVEGEQIVVNKDRFVANELLEVKTPLDIPLAAFFGEEFDDRLPSEMLEAQRQELRRAARNVHDLLKRELASDGLVDDEVSSRGLIEALHVWAVSQKPRLTVLRLRDLLGQRAWPGASDAWRFPLRDGFDAPAVIDDLQSAPALLSLLRRFDNM